MLVKHKLLIAGLFYLPVEVCLDQFQLIVWQKAVHHRRHREHGDDTEQSFQTLCAISASSVPAVVSLFVSYSQLRLI